MHILTRISFSSQFKTRRRLFLVVVEIEKVPLNSECEEGEILFQIGPRPTDKVTHSSMGVGAGVKLPAKCGCMGEGGGGGRACVGACVRVCVVCMCLRE